MTLDEAIKRIHRFVETYKICGKDNYNPTTNITKLDYEAFKSAIESLKQMESISNKSEILTGWIPCSERLPEVNQRVLVTSYGRVCYAMMISADGNSGYPVFRLQDSLNERVVCETTVHSEFTTSRIVAWMPLPEPYKAESEANTDEN